MVEIFGGLFFQRKCPFWTFYGKLDYFLFVSISVGRKYETDLADLEPFVQFKRPEKHTWRTVTFSKIAG